MKALLIAIVALVTALFPSRQGLGMVKKSEYPAAGIPTPANIGKTVDIDEAGSVKTVRSADGESQYQIPTDAQLRKNLTPLQYRITREDATETPFENAYWDNHEPGIYVDIISGEPLFSSTDKFVSGTGWPSFTRPLEPDNIVEKEDRSWFRVRTEVRSRHADSHLGHVFDDGPPPTGLRYCLNSAALRFVPKAELEEQGYGQYLNLFQNL